MTLTPHPWRALRSMPQLELCWMDMPPGLRAITDGAVIWMSRRLMQRERRSSLAHELFHVEARHVTCQPPRVERKVRFDAANWLLPKVTVVVDELVYNQGDVTTTAESLWVDDETLIARFDLEHLSMPERAYLRRRVEDAQECSDWAGSSGGIDTQRLLRHRQH